MNSLLLILILAAVAIWFAVVEVPMLFGLYEPTYALRRWVFVLIASSTVLLSTFFLQDGSVAVGVKELYAGMKVGQMTLLTVLVSALLTLSLLRMFALQGTVVYAVLGALAAYTLKLSGNVQGGATAYMLSFVAAPVLSLVAAFLIGTLLRLLFGRRRMHLIILSYHMRFAVIFAAVLTSVAVGVNAGGFLEGLLYLVPASKAITVVTVTAVLLLLAVCVLKNTAIEGTYDDFTVYDVLSVGLASSVILLFFSFESTASLLRLSPVPLSVGSLVVAAIAGTSLAGKSRVVGVDVYVREGISTLLSPLLSFLLTYLLLSFSGNGEHVVDFVVMTVAVVALLAVCFWGYVREQRHKNAATQRLLSAQQQQIYENSRALNDMEIKVVLSENYALHNMVEQKRQEVMNVALSIVEQKEYLEKLSGMVRQLAKSRSEQEREEILLELDSSLRQRLSYERDVDSQYFYAQAESLHEDFNAKLSENHPGLTQQEKRLATLLRLGFSSKYIATLMNITPKSVEISRYRLRQKLGLSKGDNLVNYIKSL